MAYQDAPSTPACVNTDPDYFEIEPLYEAGLTVCAKCDVRLWCLQMMNPAQNHYDGVVGGHAWADGEILSRYSKPERDPIVLAYLQSRRLKLKTRASRLDRLAIRLFIEGQLPWDRLTLPEIMEAAKLLMKQGYDNHQVIEATHLSWRQLTAVIQEMRDKK